MALAAGVNFSKPAVMSATATDLARRDRHAVELERARAGQRRDLHRQQGVGRGVVGVGEAEVAGGEGVDAVFQQS